MIVAGDRLVAAHMGYLAQMVSLSDTSPTSQDTWTDFGSQEIVIPDPEVAVKVDARVSSYVRRTSTTGSNASIRVRISMDGGSTWTSGGALRARVGLTSGATVRCPMFADHFVSGVATGDIIVRAQVNNLNQSSGSDWFQGRLIVRMMRQ
jgi:hypothetical protein